MLATSPALPRARHRGRLLAAGSPQRAASVRLLTPQEGSQTDLSLALALAPLALGRCSRPGAFSCRRSTRARHDRQNSSDPHCRLHLVNDLVAGQAKNTLHRRLTAWAAPDLLLIDELSYLSFDARGADLLYQVFNRRYQRASTIVTTNLPFKDWGKLFHNSAAASAIADRLVHKGLLVRIAGKSRRSDQELENAA
ncbi:ATP-binding protein [Hyalangium gracile]|uniref:ATP-binding protein n=1 Tax=Hyalangium gracile TaxID=394092 RepID=UPI001CCA2BA2|nr:ATP-binding protein [Hyalangium gracile]